MISVIVPVYNVEKYVTRCVESIMAQTLQEFELILVDDGSTDRSGSICDELKAKDSRIRVLHQKNGGLSAARNSGLKMATGEYITYIDSDDYVDASYLELLYRNAIENQAEVSVCGYRLVWEDKKKKNSGQNCRENDRIRTYTGKEAVDEIVKSNRRSMITAWGKLYHHSLREWLMYPEGKIHEDEFITYKVLYAAKKVVETEKKFYCYFQRGNSIMNNGYSRRRLDKLIALRESIVFFQERQERELAQYALKRYLLNLQIAWYRVKKYMPDQNDLLTGFEKEWDDLFRQHKTEIKEICSFVDRVSLGVFSISPRLYSIFAEIVVRVFPDN